MKKIYKCDNCKTIVTIESEIHDLGDSITCPCDTEMFWLAINIASPNNQDLLAE